MPQSMSKKASIAGSDESAFDFESTLNQLEEIVTRLESGEMPLEDSLKAFEQGIYLAKLGQKKLKQAEQRIQILLQKNEQAALEDYQPNE